MPELHLRVDEIAMAADAATPTLHFQLHLASPGSARIRNVLLDTRLRIQTGRRPYSPGERRRLGALFGPTPDWPRSLGGLDWARLSSIVPGFEGEGRVTLPVPVSYDFDLAVTRYFHGLEQGAIPLSLQFSGSILWQDEGGPLQFAPIPWSKEAACSLPLELWQAMMQRYHADRVWLDVPRALFEGIEGHRRRCGYTRLDQALDNLLDIRLRGSA